MRRVLLSAGLLGALAGLSGCTAGYGFGGIGYYDGYDDGYYEPYYGESYYGPSYYGWYDGFYYPGTGYYVYDRQGSRHRWNQRHRHYWEARRGRKQVRENWSAYRRDGDHGREWRGNGDRDGRRWDRGAGRDDRRGDANDRRDNGEQRRWDRRDETSQGVRRPGTSGGAVDQRRGGGRRGSAVAPSASSTSADPHLLDTERLPCLATLSPAAAATNPAAVDTLLVPDPVS